ncbi:MAG: Aminopeptidase YpdF (MP-, MA-, MS-, AP-,NP-specific) [Parcubacteria group bacterium GW2011_GWA2_47_16]|nr:MAG: Aminopeptidase YpdF (MP-, MA-, MS-, AP-,NP-specific) [Parcubacteria group bacterium GW2011_GWA2_47_16]
MNTGLTKIRKLLTKKNADVFWLPNHEKSGQPDTHYLSGFTGSDSHLLITKNRSYLLTDGRYLVAAKKEALGFKILDVATHRPSELLKKILPRTGKKIILIDGSVTHFSSVEKLKEKISGVGIINADGMLKELRRVKTPEELVTLKKAAQISCKAFEKLLPFVKEGVTEKWLAKKLSDLLFDCGADSLSFDPIVASGANAVLPHAKPTDKKLKSGELVLIDFGATYKGYVSDMTRTVAIGKISPKLQKIYEAVREAQEMGCGVARAGVPARAVDSTCRETLKKHGLEKYFSHSTGHGIGLEVHELPHVSSGNTNLLEAGEVITCEPGVYIKDWGGVRIEDSLVVTKKGVINLTRRVGKKLIL